MENVNKQRRKFIQSLSEFGYGPLELNFRSVRLHLTKWTKWVGIIAIKTEGRQIDFLSDVLVAIASLDLRACLHGGRVPQVARLGGVKKKPSIICNTTIPPSRGALSQCYWMVAKHVNNKNPGKPRFLAINAFLHSLAALAATFRAVAFYCYL